MAIYTQQRVNYGKDHVGTVHYRDNNPYSGSWVVNGKWQNGQTLLDRNSHLNSYSDLIGVKGHTYGAKEFVRQDPVQQSFNFEVPEAPAPATIEIPDPAPTIPTPMSIKGNAAGVKRKKSRGEQRGTSTKGTSQFNRSMFINPSAPISNINV